MQKSEHTNSDPSLRQVILIVDNRTLYQVHQRGQRTPHYDLRCSAFKQTEVDQAQSRFDFLQQEQSLMQNLAKRIGSLEKRVESLEKNEIIQTQKRKKYRRKAQQIEKKYLCPDFSCAKLYGSETSLRKHVQIKHKK